MAVELLSVEEVAKLFHVREMTVRRHIKQGKLKGVKVGGRIRVPRNEAERFIQPIASVAGITIPPSNPVPAEEIARRRALFEETVRLRERIGPIGMSTDELVRQGRLEEEAQDA